MVEGIRYLDHDADLGIEVRAADLRGIWDRGARALAGVMTDVETLDPRRRTVVELGAPDLDAAWVASLSDLLARFEIDGVLISAVDELSIREEDGALAVRFVARGEPYDPERHPDRGAVKAVTHHGARVRRLDRGGWVATVLVDV